jgi:ribosomal protein S18 acetylase RimI-like enzyme
MVRTVWPVPRTTQATIRQCRLSDLPMLEWDDLFADQRELIANAFRRQEQGKNLMLVADRNDFPIGQVWIDLAKKESQGIGILWALRVMAAYQGQGIGSQLIETAESYLRERPFTIAEIGVEKENPAARRLYERMGYRIVSDNVETWTYTTPAGRLCTETAVEWIMHKPLA